MSESRPFRGTTMSLGVKNNMANPEKVTKHLKVGFHEGQPNQQAIYEQTEAIKSEVTKQKKKKKSVSVALK